MDKYDLTVLSQRIRRQDFLPIFRTTEAQNEVDIKEKESLKDTIQGIEGLSNGVMQDEIQDELQSKIKQVTTRLAVENMVRKLNCH